MELQKRRVECSFITLNRALRSRKIAATERIGIVSNRQFSQSELSQSRLQFASARALFCENPLLERNLLKIYTERLESYQEKT